MVFIAAIFLLGAIYMFKTDKGRKYIKLYETEKKTYQSLSENGDKSPVESAKDLNTEAWGVDNCKWNQHKLSCNVYR